MNNGILFFVFNYMIYFNSLLFFFVIFLTLLKTVMHYCMFSPVINKIVIKKCYSII